MCKARFSFAARFDGACRISASYRVIFAFTRFYWTLDNDIVYLTGKFESLLIGAFTRIWRLEGIVYGAAVSSHSSLIATDLLKYLTGRETYEDLP